MVQFNQGHSEFLNFCCIRSKNNVLGLCKGILLNNICVEFTEKADVGSSNSGAGAAVTLSSKKASFKSFFPKLHTVTSRKKSFNQLLLLNLFEQSKEDEQSSTLQSKRSQVQLEDELEEELDDEG